MMLRIDIHRWFAMAVILNPKWPPKYKNTPIWTKFGRIDIHRWSSNCQLSPISMKIDI
jgi:hypothetical protein